MKQIPPIEETKSAVDKKRDGKLSIPSELMRVEKADTPFSGESEQPPVVGKSRKFRLLLIGGALILGLAGQSMLHGERWAIPGAILLGLAAIFFVVLFGKQAGPGNWLTTEPLGQQLFNLNWRGVISLLFAILFAVLAFWLFGEDIPEYFPWLAHRISIGLLIFSSFWLGKSAGGSENQSNNKKWNWLEVGILLAILGIATFMRLYRFDQIPFGLWFDEAYNGLSALLIFMYPEYLPVFVTPLPAHFLYLIAFFYKIFGVSVLAIRMVSVVFGMATVLVSFFLGTELFNRRLGLVLAFFIAVSRWDINWSRIGMHGVSVPFFEILSTVLVLLALRKQHLVFYTLAGLSLGLGLCFYTPLYVFPVVIGVFLLFLWLHKRDVFALSWRGFLFLALGAIMISVPISQFAFHQTDSFSIRLKSASIFTGKSTQEAWRAVARTTREHLLMFNYRGDRNGRHNLPGEPMLDTISGGLMVLGLALSLRRIRQPSSFLLVVWLLIMLMPGIFSLDFESPQSLRAIGSLPPAYLLALVPLHALWQEWEESPAKPAAAFIVPLVFILGAVGYINYHIYFDLQSKRSDVWGVFSTQQTIIGKVMSGLDPQAEVYVSVIYNASPTIEFLSPNTEYHLLETFDALPIPNDGGKTMVFFVEAARRQFLLQALRYYPNADLKEYKDPGGNVVLYQITLDPSDIEASQGITVSYYRDANWQEKPFRMEKRPTINADWKDGNPAQPPFGVKWQGVLYADRYGLYRFTVHSPSSSKLYLDDMLIYLEANAEGIWTAEVELAEGCHNLALTTLGKEGHFELDWMPPGDRKQTLIPSSNFFQPPISNNGLLGYYYANGDWRSPAAFLRVDPWINFNYHTQPLIRPYTVEWVGRINIIKEGQYGFKLESVDESTLFIDNKPVASANKEGVIYLSQGLHLFRLRYADRTMYTYINLYWNPGSGFESIPQEALFIH